MEQSEFVAILLYKYVTKSVTDEESKLLVKWIDAKKENEAFFMRITDRDFLREELIEFLRLKDKIPDQTQLSLITARAKQRRLSAIIGWQKAAAIFAAVTGITVAVIFGLNIIKSEPHASGVAVQQPVEDFAPGRDRALLTLSDGRIIELDSVPDEGIPDQGNSVVKTNRASELTYSSTVAMDEGDEMLQNTVRIPNGGRYRVVLPDGSRVWLNSASELRFSPAFFQKKRIVSITGEAYFEVEKRKRSTFTVQAGETKIEVLGTSFNVMAYGDETAVKTTLVEGKIRLMHQELLKEIVPGQSATVDEGGKIDVEQHVNIQKTIAWKNGIFNFDKDRLETIMKQIERWYNVEVVFEDEIPGHFVATIDRNVPVSQVLKILELTGGVQFKIAKDRIYVRKHVEQS